MSDPRLLASNGRVAHLSLRGQVAAERFVEGCMMRVCAGVAPLFDAPEGGRRQRELVLHERFLALDAIADTQADADRVFGRAGRDGYVGYVPRAALAPDPGTMTHVVAARQSFLCPEPEVKTSAAMEPVSFGAEFRVRAHYDAGRWAEVVRLAPEGQDARVAFIPAAHLRALDRPEPDPVAVALRFLGTPYYWGGNSGFGIDCSGLVQAAHLACAVPCPGDSDLQGRHLGHPLAPRAQMRRGDLLFWPGHVALAVEADVLVHANAHHMAVVQEPVADAIARIGEPFLRRL